MATYRRPRQPDGWIHLASSCLSAVRVVGSPTASAVRLEIEFRDTGSRYYANGVPQGEVADLLLAPSIGTHWNENLRDAYHWRKV